MTSHSKTHSWWWTHPQNKAAIQGRTMTLNKRLVILELIFSTPVEGEPENIPQDKLLRYAVVLPLDHVLIFLQNVYGCHKGIKLAIQESRPLKLSWPCFWKIYVRSSMTTWFIHDSGTFPDADKHGRWCNRWSCTIMHANWSWPLPPCIQTNKPTSLQDAGWKAFNFSQQVSDKEVSTAKAAMLNNFHQVQMAEYWHGNCEGYLKGTQMPILDKAMFWSDNFKVCWIFWLNSLAGTGKSTIVQMIVERLFTARWLRASFFSSQDFSDWCDLCFIFPTTMVQLVHKYPRFWSTSFHWHWGQGLVYQASRLYVNCEEIENQPTQLLTQHPSMHRANSEFTEPISLQFTEFGKCSACSQFTESCDHSLPPEKTLGNSTIYWKELLTIY